MVSVLMGYRVEQGLNATASAGCGLWGSFAVPLAGVAVLGAVACAGTCLQLLCSRRQVEVCTGMGQNKCLMPVVVKSLPALGLGSMQGMWFCYKSSSG